MQNIDDRVKAIYEYLLDIQNLSADEIRMLKRAISILHEVSPVDKPLIFKKMDDIVSASDDLYWVILVIRRRLNSVKADINVIKDPMFTALVRQGRPSTVAIEHEIRFNNGRVQELEEQQDTLENILDYVLHVQKCLDDYNWMLRDKLKSD